MLVVVGAVVLGLFCMIAGFRSAGSYTETLLTSFANEGAAAPPPALPEGFDRAQLESMQVGIKKRGSIKTFDKIACIMLFERKPICGFRFYRCDVEGQIPDGTFSASIALCPVGLFKPMTLMGIRWEAKVVEPSTPSTTTGL